MYLGGLQTSIKKNLVKKVLIQYESPKTPFFGSEREISSSEPIFPFESQQKRDFLRPKTSESLANNIFVIRAVDLYIYVISEKTG